MDSSQAQWIQEGASHILFDPAVVAAPSAAFFSAEYWADKLEGQAPGRAPALFVRHEDQSWVLRHYYRGGLPGRLIRERYTWLGLGRCRSVSEWLMLQHCRMLGLPVPRPVAAHVRRAGAFYTGDILLERILGAASLADLLADNVPVDWAGMASCIAAFHRQSIWHADLNARNILFADQRCYLIDFDRAQQRKPGVWRAANISRLKRSLDKLSGQGELHYRQPDWEAFLKAYDAAFQVS